MAAQYELLKELLNSGTKLNFGQEFFFKFYQAFILKDRWMQYIQGVGTTLLVTAMALALGFYMLAGHCALKPLFARPRPCDLRPEMLTLVARPHGWSFPSGHTSSAFAAAFALWLQNRRLGIPALVLAGFIGFTRMYLYVHFPTDILGGVALGLALGACGSLLADKISNKWAKRSEVKRTV